LNGLIVAVLAAAEFSLTHPSRQTATRQSLI